MTTSLEKELKIAAEQNKITCETAHQFAKKYAVTPKEIGQALNSLSIRIDKCQLGLFGYGPAKKNFDPSIEISSENKDKILKTQKNGRVSCLKCWELAVELQFSRLEMGSACEKLEIRIKPCQLGAF